jgi:hypothetical protein
MLKSIKYAVVFAVSAGPAFAQAVVIEHQAPSSGVVIEKHETPVVVERRTEVETERSGCSSTTVHKESDEGSKTVTKSDC